MSQRIVYERGAPCEIENCGSKEYVETDGQWFCRNGHLQARLFTQGDEEPTLGSQGRKARRRGEEREKTRATLSGQPAIELYLQCYQLVLWKQVHWLVHMKGFPVELEAVVRDLWLLRLQMMEELLESPNDQGKVSRLFSSQSEGDQSEDDEDGLVPQSISKMQKRIPRLVETLGICYLSLLLLRLPISMGDIRDWVESEELVYIHAIQVVPKAMRRNLPQSFTGALQPSSGTPELSRLHMTTSTLSTAFLELFGMAIPPLNHHLLLFRFVADLSIPLEVFPAVTRLAHLIGCNFTFLSTREKYTLVSCHPELQLLSLLVVAIKLLYPFDSVTRHPKSSSEPAALTVDWEVWIKVRERLDLAHKINKDTKEKTPVEIAEQDVFSMDGQQIDKYLDWFGATWLDEDFEDQDREADFRKAIYGLFPTGQEGGHRDDTVEAEAEETCVMYRKWKVIRKVQHALLAQETRSDKRQGNVRPGDQYTQYRNEEELPNIARPFLEAAARLGSVPLSVLLVAVNQMESRLQRWVKSQGKSKRRESSEESSGSELAYGPSHNSDVEMDED